MPKKTKTSFHLGTEDHEVTLLSMSDSADALRRWLGLFCLAVAAGMLIWGQTILKPILEGVWYVIYWLICFFFTIAAIGIALLDVRAVRRRTREEQTELIRKTLEKIEAEAKEKGDEQSKN
jgi:hypothetical protein